MYKIYTTDAFVLSAWPVGEASARFTVFTKELGLVHAHGQGVRLLASKLRAGLQTLTHNSISLVRGKEVWRITSAVASSEQVDLGCSSRVLWARVLALISRLVHGEAADPWLYETIDELYKFLALDSLTVDETKHLEILITLRVLAHLGYVGYRTHTITNLLQVLISKTILTDVAREEASLQRIINAALQASQL